jgi:hypothetical protein
MGNRFGCVGDANDDVVHNVTQVKIKSEKLYSERRYASHPEAIILMCYFNPTRSIYRKKTFDKFYATIKHLNHQVIELAIGDNAWELQKEIPELQREGACGVRCIRTDMLLWHKEGLLNILLKELPPSCKYVFWLDTDLIFSDSNWLISSIEKLQSCTIVQPFEYCVHLEKDEVAPSFDVVQAKARCRTVVSPRSARRVWRSFGANYEKGNEELFNSEDYDLHGHVGFAWGARREVLESSGGFFDRGLIGGADHVMAHAAVGQIPHPCIQKVRSLSLIGDQPCLTFLSST